MSNKDGGVLVPRVIFDSGGPGAPPQTPSRAGPIERVPTGRVSLARTMAGGGTPSATLLQQLLQAAAHAFFLVILRAREGLPLTRGLTPRAKPECTAVQPPSWMPAHATAVL